jgi:hypothetical protein
MSNHTIANKLSKALTDIRLSFISGQDYSRIDREIGKSLDRLSVSDINRNTINYAETMKQYITQNVDTTSMGKEVTSGILNSPDTLQRYGRYGNAEEVLYNIPQCSRALRVLVSGIMSPDNVTKTSLKFMSDDNSEAEETNEILNNLRILNKEIKFDTYLDSIITETLKYGDKFVEFCSYKSKEIPITQTMYLQEKLLHENNNFAGPAPVMQADMDYEIRYKQLNEHKSINADHPIFDERVAKFSVEIVEDVLDSDSLLYEAIQDKDKSKLYRNISEIRILQHDPRRVVKLQSERFKINLGYLILPEGIEGQSGMGLGAMSSSGISYASAGAVPIAAGLNNELFMGVDGVYADLVKTIKKHVNTKDLKVNKKEMKEILARLISDLDDNIDKTNIKIRYVPPERMEHFLINERINFPYGEGIFEKSMHAAKELIALKTAITVRRITDSVDKRVIYIESNLPRNSNNMITHLKEALRKRKFSMGSLSNISSIPTMMTNFEDYIITTRNGKRSVEFETIPTSSNIRDMTDELKFFRDELISSLDVPPAYIGIEDNINGKTTLAHESALFAEIILYYQAIFNKHIFNFFNNLHKTLHGKKIPDTIQISLPPPKMLFIGNELENLENISRIIELGPSLDIDKDVLRKKYLSFDWEEIEDAKIKDTLEKRGNPSPNDDAGGMGGGMGMGMPMGGMGGGF